MQSELHIELEYGSDAMGSFAMLLGSDAVGSFAMLLINALILPLKALSVPYFLAIIVV